MACLTILRRQAYLQKFLMRIS
uniref:Uncharacterized protein n=1 Tax=Arundo donax TaxID=35708 RepID=A0A0A9EDB2_ARUDO